MHGRFTYEKCFSSLAKRRAEDGIRTRDLRFTKPLLYQLSYFGLTAERGNMPPADEAASGSGVGRVICVAQMRLHEKTTRKGR